MSDGKQTGPACVCESHCERFDYVRRGPDGEYIIPRDKIDHFVHTYLELLDSAEHMERLKLYRGSAARDAGSD
ncbi:hypothetical protein NNJEOMEG_03215 [Fundidesulfovibrio magnetotacticus]|uniref:Uncharacterized protein n=1 Tax=Fundidesulfovibrio magnetotacticus TaxID=2730080 RepID=A0A6V8LSA5_9BACT|nr:hypothetical protein [Fundidesulfovibrio magnetotacticus]GFK95353.1 hypothetical protein NNJEOMEG_03215 [Fundidesulfovibrio magnetotacticus]